MCIVHFFHFPRQYVSRLFNEGLPVARFSLSTSYLRGSWFSDLNAFDHFWPLFKNEYLLFCWECKTISSVECKIQYNTFAPPSEGSAWLHRAKFPFVLEKNIFSSSFQVSSRYFTFDEGREMLRWNLGRCEEGVLLLIKFYFLSPTPVLKRRPGTSREQFFLVSITLQKINLSGWSVEGTKEMKSLFDIFNISIRL